MFAGIVEVAGLVVANRATERGARLTLDGRGLFDELPAGASVAVNGACLTLAAADGPRGHFDAVPETLQRTNLGDLRPGDAVNLERSLRLGDRIDGHMVQGHVDHLGRVLRIDRSGGQWKLWMQTAVAAMPCIVPKGSIALDGVSLTVVDVAAERFSVALIPTTLERTTLGRRQAGDAINIETDYLARLAIARIDALLAGRAERGGTVSWGQLQSAGYTP